MRLQLEAKTTIIHHDANVTLTSCDSSPLFYESVRMDGRAPNDK